MRPDKNLPAVIKIQEIVLFFKTVKVINGDKHLITKLPFSNTYPYSLEEQDFKGMYVDTKI